MPTYAYVCRDCGRTTEAVQAFTDPSLTVCPHCGGRLRKQYGTVGVTFNGSGFYRTDSRAGAKGEGGGSGEGASKGDSGAASGGGSTDGGSKSGGSSEGGSKSDGAKPTAAKPAATGSTGSGSAA